MGSPRVGSNPTGVAFESDSPPAVTCSKHYAKSLTLRHPIQISELDWTLAIAWPLCCLEIFAFQIHAQDTLAERLRRRPAKPMGSPRVGSNPTGVAFDQNFPAVF